MPPKIKTISPESMATQPDSPPPADPSDDLPETQCVQVPEAQPKRKRGRPKGRASTAKTNKGRPTKTTLVRHLISEKTLVHPEVVQKVLSELENLCVETVRTNGVFRMSFITVKLRIREAREEVVKRLAGKDVAFKAKPEKRILKILPGKSLKELCK